MGGLDNTRRKPTLVTEAQGCWTGAMQDPASELRRISIPRTPVNKGKRKGRGSYAPALAPFSASKRYGIASCTTKLP
jgi:hypothetical protein